MYSFGVTASAAVDNFGHWCKNKTAFDLINLLQRIIDNDSKKTEMNSTNIVYFIYFIFAVTVMLNLGIYLI